LRIQIVDEKNRPMFDLASSELKPYTKVILREIGRALNQVENRISLSGHTDSTPYAGPASNFGNWELSTNRSNASRRELVAGGMNDVKVMRVVGMGSSVPFNREDPYAPINRRISIVVMNKKTEESILADGRMPEVDVAQAGDAQALEGTVGTVVNQGGAPAGVVPPSAPAAH
jgi:chemotaxis protein MotB